MIKKANFFHLKNARTLDFTGKIGILSMNLPNSSA